MPQGEERESSYRAVVASVLSARMDGRWLNQADCAVLRTLMLLAAADGEVSRDELAYFRSVIDEYRDGIGGLTRDALWKSALHGAGYLILQGQFLSRDERIAAFVEEAASDFIEEMATCSDEERRVAFGHLEEMARADGVFSDMERDCLLALESRISSERASIRMNRYPHEMSIRL